MLKITSYSKNIDDSQKQMVKMVNVKLQTTCDRSKAMGKIFKSFTNGTTDRRNRKSELQRIVSGYENRICIQNPKRKNTRVKPSQPSTLAVKLDRL